MIAAESELQDVLPQYVARASLKRESGGHAQQYELCARLEAVHLLCGAQ